MIIMKQVIRYDTFETNSSSCHSLAIPKSSRKKRNYPNAVHFGIGEFGWDVAVDNDPADYLYTAILTYHPWNPNQEFDREGKLDYLKKILDKHNIRYTFDEPKWETWDDRQFLDNGYIDHSDELGEFLDAVFSSETALLDFIFYGIVITGNDNYEVETGWAQIHPMAKTCEKCVYNKETKEWEEKEVPNPYYNPEYENYSWYEKGN